MCLCCCQCLSDIILVAVSIIFPPLPVWFRRGFCSGDSWLNILLCIIGYFPGLIHSWYIIARYPEPNAAVHRVDLESQTMGQGQNVYHQYYQPTTINRVHLVEARPHENPSYGAVAPPSHPPAYSE